MGILTLIVVTIEARATNINNQFHFFFEESSFCFPNCLKLMKFQKKILWILALRRKLWRITENRKISCIKKLRVLLSAALDAQFPKKNEHHCKNRSNDFYEVGRANICSELTTFRVECYHKWGMKNLHNLFYPGTIIIVP